MLALFPPHGDDGHKFVQIVNRIIYLKMTMKALTDMLPPLKNNAGYYRLNHTVKVFLFLPNAKISRNLTSRD